MNDAKEAKRVPGCGGLIRYTGPANSPDIIRHLVAERITAAFRDDDGKVWIVTQDGRAVVFGCGPGHTGGPAYWVEQPDAVRRVVDARAARIRMQLDELRDLPGVRLP